MLKLGDAKNLSKELIEKQKIKGTYDSPCMSICNYSGELDQCGTCSMLKDEKRSWKAADKVQKESILKAILNRR